MARIFTTTYNKFKGVDFSSDAALVDKERSPTAKNIISDSAGMPEKRVGWRVIADVGDNGQAVHGLFDATIEGVTYFVAHIGSGIYLLDPEAGSLTLLYACRGAQRSAGLNLCGKLWILTGAEYLCFDGATVRAVSGMAYVPTTLISCSPAGGGTFFESINLLTPARINSFLADGTSTNYYVDSTDLTAVDEVWVDGYAYPMAGAILTEAAAGDGITTAFPLQSPLALSGCTAVVGGTAASGGFDSATKVFTFASAPAAGAVIMFQLTARYCWTIDYSSGKISFAHAPSAPAAGAADTVRIQFRKNISGYADQINHCGIITSFGVGSRDRVVTSGNPQYPNRDWTSAYNNPAYIPDDSYNVVGSEATAIMGYAPIGAYMAIIKADNGQDATIYMRSSGLDGEGNAMFPTVQGVSGVGALAPGVIGLINDEPVFLSSTGLFALTSDVITAERIVKNRSYYMDAWLVREPDLYRAISMRWRGYFIICVNDHCYILDGAGQKSYWERSSGDYVYECYYWENIPANCFLNHRALAGEELYFGTTDGRICRLNTDVEDMSRYQDGGRLQRRENGSVYLSGGVAIDAVWSTRSDDDGDPTRHKTMIKQGCAATFKPFARSGGDIYFRTDRDSSDVPITQRMDIFDFNDISFERFSFNTNDAPREVFFRVKLKKYKRLQIIVRNSNINEGFGLFGVTKHYVFGNFARR